MSYAVRILASLGVIGLAAGSAAALGMVADGYGYGVIGGSIMASIIWGGLDIVWVR